MFKLLCKFKPIHFKFIRNFFSSSHGPQLGELELPLLEELQFLAAAEPQTTFWRATDVVLATFEALKVVPVGHRTAYREVAADSCKTVLSKVRKYGQKSLTHDVKEHLESVMNTLDHLKKHANNDVDFEHELDALRSVIAERQKPQSDKYFVKGNGKNVSHNLGTLYGMNNGDSGSVNFKRGNDLILDD